MAWLKKKWDACRAWARRRDCGCSPLSPQNYLCAGWGAFLLGGGAKLLVDEGPSLSLLFTGPLFLISGLVLLLLVCFPWIVVDHVRDEQGRPLPNIVRAGVKLAIMIAYTEIAVSRI